MFMCMMLIFFMFTSGIACATEQKLPYELYDNLSEQEFKRAEITMQLYGGLYLIDEENKVVGIAFPKPSELEEIKGGILKDQEKQMGQWKKDKKRQEHIGATEIMPSKSLRQKLIKSEGEGFQPQEPIETFDLQRVSRSVLSWGDPNIPLSALLGRVQSGKYITFSD